MERFYFDESASISLEVINSKLAYLNNTDKFKLTFYNSLLEITSIIFNNVEELVNFIYTIKFFLENLNYDSIAQVIRLYDSIPDATGNHISIDMYYKYIEYSPSDQDDIIQIFITKINDFTKQYSVIYSVDTNEYIIDNFLIYIFEFLESISIDVKNIVLNEYNEYLNNIYNDRRDLL